MEKSSTPRSFFCIFKFHLVLRNEAIGVANLALTDRTIGVADLALTDKAIECRAFSAGKSQDAD